MINEICIGSAQFGFNYGITNTTGKVKENDVKKILKLASELNIKYIDTAQAYKSSEEVIGVNAPSENEFRMISKFSPLLTKTNKENLITDLEDGFQRSLKALKKTNIDSLLFHNANDLKNESFPIIFDWINSLKERNLIKRIGLSIYSKSDLDKVNVKKFDLVQLPLSIYDQRLLNDGTIKFLRQIGISVHVRSIFLQGLILNNPKKWPPIISKEFKDHHSNFFNFLNLKKLNKLEEVMKFPFFIKDVEAVVLGITSFQEFYEITKIWNKLTKQKDININDFKKWEWTNCNDLDPRKW